jgi:hypothetical protein
MIASLQQQLASIRQRLSSRQPPGEVKFGAFAGVFAPTVLIMQ